MNPLELSSISDADARELQWRMDGLRPGELLKFQNFGPLALCKPKYTDLLFFKKDGCYCMALDPPVNYPGSYPPMTHLCSQDYVYFREFSMLLDFIRELVCHDSPPQPASAPASPNAPPQEDYDVGKVVNTSEVKVPKKAARASPDRKTIQRELEKIVMGQKTATETIAHQAALFLGKKNPKKPLSIMTYGPPGTGKTETAKALAKVLSKLGPHQYSSTIIDLNQFTEAHSVSLLIGAPPSYVGYEEAGALETIAQQKYCIVVFDELDKANSAVLQVLMSIIDTGKTMARRRQEDGSNELDLSHTILIFTSNFRLGESANKRKIGFSYSDDVEDIRRDGDALEVCYTEDTPEDEQTALTRRIYKNIESARKAFIEAGVLPEISSRFSVFCEFFELTPEAKIEILAKMVIEAGFEYNVRIKKLSAEILQALIDAATTEDVLTVRSYKVVIESNLAEIFAQAGEKYPGRSISITGTLEKPIIKPS